MSSHWLFPLRCVIFQGKRIHRYFVIQAAGILTNVKQSCLNHNHHNTVTLLSEPLKVSQTPFPLLGSNNLINISEFTYNISWWRCNAIIVVADGGVGGYSHCLCYKLTAVVEKLLELHLPTNLWKCLLDREMVHGYYVTDYIDGGVVWYLVGLLQLHQPD